MEDDLNVLFNGRQPQYFLKENDFNIFFNGRRLQYIFKWKMTSIILEWKTNLKKLKMEDDLKNQSNQNKIKLKTKNQSNQKQIKIKTMVVTWLRVT